MPITADVRKAREAVMDQSKAVLEDARKPLYAVVGAGDLAVSRTASQLRELPADYQSAVDIRVKQVRTRIEDLRTDVLTRITELRGRATELQGRATDTAGKAFVTPSELKSRVETYLDKAKEVYEDLAARGEKVVTKVSDRPAVKSVVDRAETLFDRAGDTVEDAAATAEAATEPTSHKAPTRKAATRTQANGHPDTEPSD
jgi:heparin binding hemagglutinin HbhA